MGKEYEGVRECGQGVRTPLATFFNFPQRDLVDGIDDERGDKPQCSFHEEKRDAIPSKFFYPAWFWVRSHETFGCNRSHDRVPFSGKELQSPLRGKAT
jgi:hypothetical protein